MTVSTRRFTAPDTEVTEAVEAVRSVLVETLDRAAKNLAEGERIPWSVLADAGLLGAGRARGARRRGARPGRGRGAAARDRQPAPSSSRCWETLCCGVLTLAAHGSDEQQAGAAARRRHRRGGPDAGAPRGRPPARRGAADDVRRRHGHRPQDRRHLRRGRGPAARHRRRRATSRSSRWSTSATRASRCSSRARRRADDQHTVVLDGAPAELLLERAARAPHADRAVRRRALPHRRRRGRRRPRPHRGLHQGPHPVRPQRWRSSRPSRCRSRTSTSPRAPSTWPPRTPPGGSQNGLDATDDLAVAAYWVCTEAPPALRTCHHLHGGMGVDVTYPLHRYFSWVTDIAHALDVPSEAVPVEDPTTKNLELTAAQRALKAELRTYFTGLADHNEHREMGAGPARRGLPARGPADGRRRLDGRRLAEGVRRPRARRDRADDLRQRGPARRRAPPGGDAADRRPDADPLRHREAEGPVPLADPGRRRALRDRLLRAGRRHRPRLAADARPSATATTTSSTARRCGRPAATRPTTSGWRCAPTRTRRSTRASRS